MILIDWTTELVTTSCSLKITFIRSILQKTIVHTYDHLKVKTYLVLLLFKKKKNILFIFNQITIIRYFDKYMNIKYTANLWFTWRNLTVKNSIVKNLNSNKLKYFLNIKVIEYH